MTLKTFIKTNAVSLIVSFFCIGVFIGLSGSIAQILLSFFVGVYFGIKIKKGDFRNQFIQQVQEIIIERSALNKLAKKRK